MAKHTKKDFAILENEYGAAGIDADRLRAEEGQSPVNIWEMTEGCICCSAKGDFSLSVLSIANTIDPEYLVIEPTGVGMLGNVMENLKQIEYEHISILAPVTIADIYSYRRYLKEYPALYENQIKDAGTIFLSKSEQASAEEKEEARQVLAGINPTATIYTDHYSSLPEKDWLRLLETGYDGRLYQVKAEETENLPDTFSIENAYFSSPESLLIFLEDLIRDSTEIFSAPKDRSLPVPSGFSLMADSRYGITGCEPQKTEKLYSSAQRSTDNPSAVWY
ncbi:MAG: GTP-binding protein [Clostridium sp.]